jgi:uncharacterized repeat protein (TIGR03803 family)
MIFQDKVRTSTPREFSLRIASGSYRPNFTQIPSGKADECNRDITTGSGMTLGTDGYFYGTTDYGGTYGYGTVFRITRTGDLTTLYNFSNGSDGAIPFAPPVEGRYGNFYGTTFGCYPSAETWQSRLLDLCPAN